MKRSVIINLVVVFLLVQLQAQETIHLSYKPMPATFKWDRAETVSKSPYDAQNLVSNVAEPSLTVYRPKTPNGTALVIAPGGGFHFLAIDNEGTSVAEWCTSQGITAFVLKYRLVPTGDNPVAEFIQKLQNRDQMDNNMAAYIEMAKEDGITAIEYVRKNADKYGIDTDRIGIMGFSAGGTVAGHSAFHHTSASRPNFSVPIYPALHVVDTDQLPQEPMPVFIAVTSDDSFGFQKQSIEMYQMWNKNGHPVELHIYERGGHGFGMKKQDLPSDGWIDDFASWLRLHNWLK